VSFHNGLADFRDDDADGQAHREGGVAGASAPRPGGPKGAAGVKRDESKQAEMGRLKTVHQTQYASSCPVGSKTCHVLLDDCQKQKSQTGPKSVESKETRLFYRGLLLNYIPVLYCDFGF